MVVDLGCSGKHSPLKGVSSRLIGPLHHATQVCKRVVGWPTRRWTGVDVNVAFQQALMFVVMTEKT